MKSLQTFGFLVYRDHHGIFFLRSNEYRMVVAEGKSLESALDNLSSKISELSLNQYN